MRINISNKFIGEEESCFIIAEVGVNHNGSTELAKKLIDAAKDAGADAVKFQTFKAEEVVSKDVPMAKYQKENINKNGLQLEMIKKLELNYKDFIELKEYCDNRDIIFLSTPHCESSVDFLEPLVPAYKVGSGDLTNLPFLEKIAKKCKPIILSTGMGTIKEIREAIKIIRINSKDKLKLILLHCTTNYPCSLEEVNLRAMQTMREEFNCLVGYSDHTLSINVPIIAVILGACIIEKHFTLNKNLPGPDHKASLELKEFKEMVKKIKNIEIRLKDGESLVKILEEIPYVEKILGKDIKKPTTEEEKIKPLVRKSIIAKVDIPKNTIITSNMLIIKRPGTGIKPKHLNKVIGKKAKYNIKKDEIITWDKIY